MSSPPSSQPSPSAERFERNGVPCTRSRRILRQAMSNERRRRVTYSIGPYARFEDLHFLEVFNLDNASANGSEQSVGKLDSQFLSRPGAPGPERCIAEAKFLDFRQAQKCLRLSPRGRGYVSIALRYEAQNVVEKANNVSVASNKFSGLMVV